MFIQSHHSKDWANCEDEKLWCAFVQGNREALSELFARYYVMLFRYGIKIISSEEEVKDCVQKLFLRLWKRRQSLAQAEVVKLYLLTSLRRILLRENKRRQSKKKRNYKYVDSFPTRRSTIEDSLIKSEEDQERRQLLEAALTTLTNRQRETVFLRFYEGLSNQEISGVMEITHQRVRNLLYEATQRLKEAIYHKKH